MNIYIDAIIHFWNTNQVVNAIGTFSAFICVCWTIVANATKFATFLWIALSESFVVAERRKRFELALIARRCAEDASCYLAYITRIICLHLSVFAISMFLLSKMILDWFDPAFSKNRALMMFSNFSATIVAVIGILSIAMLVSRSVQIASIVIIYKRRGRQRELGSHAAFGRIKRTS
jgi:hypothetical protein